MIILCQLLQYEHVRDKKQHSPSKSTSARSIAAAIGSHYEKALP